jgi:murein L,D-transpeptidase YafK
VGQKKPQSTQVETPPVSAPIPIVEEAKPQVPAAFVSLNPQTETFYLILDKTSVKLNLYNSSGFLVKSYACSSADSAKGLTDKAIPSGIYFITEKKENKTEEYTLFDFKLNFPNVVDEDTSVSNLYLRSESSDSLAKAETDIVIPAVDLLELQNYIEIVKTPIIIYDKMEMVPEGAKAGEGADIKSFLSQWAKYFNEKDLTNYGFCYSDSFRYRKGGKSEWLKEREKFFKRNTHIAIEIDKLMIIACEKYDIALFDQLSAIDGVKDKGFKRLYLSKKEDKWEIRAEEYFPGK